MLGKVNNFKVNARSNDFALRKNRMGSIPSTPAHIGVILQGEAYWLLICKIITLHSHEYLLPILPENFRKDAKLLACNVCIDKVCMYSFKVDERKQKGINKILFYFLRCRLRIFFLYKEKR